MTRTISSNHGGRRLLDSIPSSSTRWWTRPGKDEQLMLPTRTSGDKTRFDTKTRTNQNNTSFIHSTSLRRGRATSSPSCNPPEARKAAVTTTPFAGASNKLNSSCDDGLAIAKRAAFPIPPSTNLAPNSASREPHRATPPSTSLLHIC